MYIAGSIVFAGNTVKTTKHTLEKELTFISYLYIVILTVIFILFFTNGVYTQNVVLSLLTNSVWTV